MARKQTFEGQLTLFDTQEQRHEAELVHEDASCIIYESKGVVMAQDSLGNVMLVHKAQTRIDCVQFAIQDDNPTLNPSDRIHTNFFTTSAGLRALLTRLSTLT